MNDRYTYAYYPQSAAVLTGILAFGLSGILGIFFFAGLSWITALVWLALIGVISALSYHALMRLRSDIVLDDIGISRYLPSRMLFQIPWTCIAWVRIGANLQSKGPPVTYYWVHLTDEGVARMLPRRVRILADMIRDEAFAQTFERALRDHGVPCIQ